MTCLDCACVVRWTRWLVLLLLAATTSAPTLAADDDDEPRRPLPGMIARYYVGSESKPLFTRLDPVPTFLLQKNEAPDPRLPATGWRADWQGTLQILRAGKYEFFIRSSDEVTLTIRDKTVAAHRGGDGATRATVELPFGYHPIAVTYAVGEAANLRLSWQGEGFVEEPLPGRVLGHFADAKGKDEATADLFPHGRLLVEEHSCTACHKPSSKVKLASMLVTRPGPRLTDAGKRLKAGWIYYWLGDPQAYRPEAVMPKMFGDDEVSRTQRYAVARFLASFGQPGKPEKEVDLKQRLNLAKAGAERYKRMGCVVCHEKDSDSPSRATLASLPQKYHLPALRDYIKNPGQFDPASRMPQFQFKNDNETVELMYYLVDRDADEQKPLELPPAPQAEAVKLAFAALKPDASAEKTFGERSVDEQLMLLAKQTMFSRRCTNCHEMKVNGSDKEWKERAAETDFAAVATKGTGGCLSTERTEENRHVPVFGKTLELPPVKALLAAAITAPATAAPAEFARLTLERFNCLGCHDRNGQGGLDPKLVESLLKTLPPADANAEAVSPPTLTGIGEKALTKYLHNVIVDGRRARPWLSIQMPRFHGNLVKHMPAGLAALDAEPVRDTPHVPRFDAEYAKAGLALVGEKGFGCIKCHDMLGIESGGTRGPDLSTVSDRINYDWYLRWITDPQRIHPGTRMPTVFLKGESPHKDILQGSVEKQREAIWQYLLVSPRYPRPEGLNTAKSVYIAQTPGPFIMRSFLQDIPTARGIAIRYPNGVHLAFDGQNCRMVYSWVGGFVDMAPMWNNRGGNPAQREGGIVWTAPKFFPWEITGDAEAMPDYSGREGNSTFGATIKDPKQADPVVKFRSYQMLEGKTPVLNYEYHSPSGDLVVAETPSTNRNDAANGIVREFSITGPAGKQAWLLAASSSTMPTWRTADGKTGSLADGEAKTQRQAIPADATVLVTQENKPLVMHLRAMSGAKWAAVQKDGKWNLLVTAPLGKDPVKFALELWSPVDEKVESAEKLLSQR